MIISYNYLYTKVRTSYVSSGEVVREEGKQRSNYYVHLSLLGLFCSSSAQAELDCSDNITI